MKALATIRRPLGRSIRIDAGLQRRRRRPLAAGLMIVIAVGFASLAPHAHAQDPEGEATPTAEEQPTPTVRLLPEDLILPEGIGTVDLLLANGPSASTITIWLYMDPDRFAVTSITRGPLLAAYDADLAHQIDNGYLTLRATFEPPAAEAPLGDGAIARIGIAALQPGTGEIQFDGLEIIDVEGAAIDALAEGAVSVEVEAAPGPAALEDVAAQVTALSEAAVQEGLPGSARRRGLLTSLVRSVSDLGPTAAWLALLAAAAGVTGIAWLIGREDTPDEHRWIMEDQPDDHRRSML